ncbi:hypothetical protein P3T73_06460 [Kiritimatiellota bacterium B12222]|nr:hypothetical protein P3T73_06460 [Kiritimatiellota bacterium B12222]
MNSPSKPLLQSPKRFFGFGVLLMVSCALAMYHRSLGQPFVQDDWKILHYLLYSDTVTVLTDFWIPDGLFYRPLSMTYHVLMYAVAGLNPLIPHTFLLIWISLCGTLIAILAREFQLRPLPALLIGTLWVGSCFLMHDVVLWMVGINEGLYLALLMGSLLCLIKGRPKSASLLLLSSLLCKEAAISLPISLAAYSILHLCCNGPSSFSDFRKYCKTWAPMYIVSFGYLVFRLIARLSYQPVVHPSYQFQFGAEEQLHVWTTFPLWILKTLLPWNQNASVYSRIEEVLGQHPLLSLLSLFILTAIALFLMIRADRCQQPAEDAWIHSPRVFLFCWFGAACLPFIIIPNHAYRYYLLHPFIPLLLLNAILIRDLQWTKKYPQTATLLLSLFALQFFIGNYRYNLHMQKVPIDYQQAYGLNNLSEKAHYVNILARDLPQLLPDLAPQQMVVIQGQPLHGTLAYMAPEIWYHKRPLYINGQESVRIENGFVHGHHNGLPIKTPIDQTIFLTLDSENLTYATEAPLQ